MAGIGEYKKGAKFTLKSGNKIDPGAFFKGEVKINPSQKSGVYYKSPLEKDDSEDKEEEYDPYNVSGDKDKDEDEKEVVGSDKPGTKAWKIAANALIGGFDAITGERTKRPRINFGKHKEEVAADSPEENVKELLSDPKKGKKALFTPTIEKFVEFTSDGKMIMPDDPKHSSNITKNKPFQG